MKDVKEIKQTLIKCVKEQVSEHLDEIDTKELGEAIDMIKDLAQTEYYCLMINDMYSSSNDESEHVLMDDKASKNIGGDSQGHKSTYNIQALVKKDSHEGHSGESRRVYLEGKANKDKNKSIQELEVYVKDLTQDIMEMIADASPEEKQILQQKMSLLATKIK